MGSPGNVILINNTGSKAVHTDERRQDRVQRRMARDDLEHLKAVEKGKGGGLG